MLVLVFVLNNHPVYHMFRITWKFARIKVAHRDSDELSVISKMPLVWDWTLCKISTCLFVLYLYWLFLLEERNAYNSMQTRLFLIRKYVIEVIL